MADLTATVTLVSAKSPNTSLTYTGVADEISCSATGRLIGTQTIGTSEEALDLGQVGSATLGLCLIVNTDSTNFVEMRQGTGTTNLMKWKAGEAFLFRFSLDTTAPFMIADSGSVVIEIWLHDD